jgi:hypothetical protein
MIKINNEIITGRYQCYYYLLNFLYNRPHNEIELQLAKNNDRKELDEIVKKFKKIKNDFQSSNTITHLDIKSLFNELRELIKEPANNFILYENNRLNDEIMSLFEEFACFLIDDHKIIKEYVTAIAYNNMLSYNILGKLVTSEFDTNAWEIFETIHGDKNILMMHFATIHISQLDRDKESVLSVAKIFLKGKKISGDDYEEIIKSINSGIEKREDKGFSEGKSLSIGETEDYKK